MTEVLRAAADSLYTDCGCALVRVFLDEPHGPGERLIARAGDEAASNRPAVLRFAFEDRRRLRFELDFRADVDAALRATAFARAAAAAKQAGAGELLDEPSPRPRVLIVDDDFAARAALRQILEAHNFIVHDAENGVLAHAEAIRLRPDLILMDWQMPVLDGCAATARLKRDVLTTAIPVIMVTGRLQPAEKLDALAAGVGDFIVRPFKSEVLIAAVGRQLQAPWRGAAPIVKVRDDAQLPHADALSLDDWIAQAQGHEEAGRFEDAARLYLRASDVAEQLANPDLANKFLRLSGKMYLCAAESAGDADAIRRNYSNAARQFLAAGNLKLATRAHESAKTFVKRPAASLR